MHHWLGHMVGGEARILLDRFLVTVRNSSCRKVMFSQACVKYVKNSVHRVACMTGVCLWLGVGLCMAGGGMCVRNRRDDHCSGWYASYWNAFLFSLIFVASLLNINITLDSL